MIRSNCYIAFNWFKNVIKSSLTVDFGVTKTIATVFSGCWPSYSKHKIPNFITVLGHCHLPHLILLITSALVLFVYQFLITFFFPSSFPQLSIFVIQHLFKIRFRVICLSHYSSPSINYCINLLFSVLHLDTYLDTPLDTYLNTYLNTHLSTYLNTYLNTYLY